MCSFVRLRLLFGWLFLLGAYITISRCCHCQAERTLTTKKKVTLMPAAARRRRPSHATGAPCRYCTVLFPEERIDFRSLGIGVVGSTREQGLLQQVLLNEI